MLKDITLGQYFPGDTVVHRLDPRTKLILVVLYIIALFQAEYFLTYGLVLLVLSVLIALAQMKLSVITKGLKPVVILLLITAAINLLYTPGQVPLVSVWKITIYREGLATAFFMVLRIMLLIVGTFLLTYTTSPIMLTDGIEKLLGPLKKIKLPVHELAMMMSIALRFIPTLTEETDKIMSAQRARGASFDEGNLFQRAKAMVPMLVPLFVSAFRRADELAVAMECRCYRGGEGRTQMRQLQYQRRDYLALAGGVLFCFGIIFLGNRGL